MGSEKTDLDWNVFSRKTDGLNSKSKELFFSCHSIWWRLLATPEPRWIRRYRHRRGLLPLQALVPRGIRTLPHHLRLPPHQNTQAASAWDTCQRRQDPQGPDAETTAATAAQAPRHHQNPQPPAGITAPGPADPKPGSQVTFDSSFWASNWTVISSDAQPLSFQAPVCFLNAEWRWVCLGLHLI